MKPATLEFQELEKEEKVESVVPRATIQPVKKVAHAPGNLPIMEGALPQFGIEEVDLVTEEHFPDTEAVSMEAVEEAHLATESIFDPTAEPTVEEYKRRLNELLKGKSI